MSLITQYKQSSWNWFQSQRLVVKLRVAFASLAVLTLIVGMVGIFTCGLLNSRVETAYQRDLPVVSAIKEAGISQLKAMRTLIRVILAAGDNDEIDKLDKDLLTSLAAERAQLKTCRDKINSSEGIAQLDAAGKLIPKFEKGARDIVTAAKAGDVIGFRSTMLELVPVSDEIQHSFDRVSQITENQAVKSKLIAVLSYWGARFLMVPLLLVAGLIATTMSYVMSNLFAAPISRIIRVLEAVAGGDLTQRLPENSHDEMGQLAYSLNEALGGVRRMLQQFNQTALGLQETSNNLAGTASVLADGTATQAVHLEETSASLEEISATIRTNADHASAANSLGSAARDVAQQGDLSVHAATAAMEEIRDSSDEISNILSAINDMAFQSNLLAINASIEAARAGESGRSFNVVATEMRLLAERSKEYSREIARLIAKSLDRVKKGSTLVDQSGKALGKIIISVKGLTTTVQEIDEACKQQMLGVEQVAMSMNKVDGVVQETALKTQQVSASAQQLASAAAGLTETLSHFTFDGHSNSALQPVDDLSDSVDAVKTWVSSRYHDVRKLVSSAS